MNSNQTRARTLNSFDEVGVNNYIKDKAVLNWFRKAVQRYEVRTAKQAQLAALLLSEASNHNEGWLTLPFIKRYGDYIPSFVEHGSEPAIDEKLGEQIKLEAVQHQLQRELKNFMRGLGSMSRSDFVIDGLLRKYPQAPFRINTQSRSSIQLAKRLINALAEKLDI
jgi:hypothetical protein